MWESNIVCISSTLPSRRSTRLGALTCAWEEGYGISSGTEVKRSISSSMLPHSSASSSLGIWDTPMLGPGMWALLRMMVCSLIGSSLCIIVSLLGIFTLAFKTRDMTRLGNGKVSLAVLFLMLLMKGDKCDHRCRSPCEWKDHRGTWSLALTRSSSSSLDRGWRSWCRPKLAFQWWTQSCARLSSWVILQELPQKAQVSPFTRHIVEMCPKSLVKSPKPLELVPLKLRTFSPLTNS